MRGISSAIARRRSLHAAPGLGTPRAGHGRSAEIDATMSVILNQGSSMHKYPIKCAEEHLIAKWRMHSASCSGLRTVEEGSQQRDAGIACTVNPKMI